MRLNIIGLSIYLQSFYQCFVNEKVDMSVSHRQMEFLSFHIFTLSQSDLASIIFMYTSIPEEELMPQI